MPEDRFKGGTVKIRCWSAVLDQGIVMAELVDVADEASFLAILDGNTDVRRWGWLHGVDPAFPHMRDPKPDGRHDPGCRVGAPCDLCHIRARKWWKDWEEREAKRQPAQGALFSERAAKEIGR